MVGTGAPRHSPGTDGEKTDIAPPHAEVALYCVFWGVSVGTAATQVRLSPLSPGLAMQQRTVIQDVAV
jgi:hypothetical protein